MAPKRTRSWSRVQRSDAAAVSPARLDGWQNIFSGLGDPARDKRLSTQMVGRRLTYEEAEQLWRYDDMAARIVELPVEEMTREGFDILIPGDKEASEAMQQALDDLGFDPASVEVLQFQRGYGGGAMLLGIDDGQKDLSKPLREDRIRKINFLTTLKPKEAQGITYYADPGAPKYGLTETYRVVPELASTNATFPWLPEVHESRMLVFQGIQTSRRMLRENFGWGDPIFVRVLEVIRDFQAAHGSAAALVPDFAQAIFSINGLREMLAADDGSDRLKVRIRAMDYARSVIRAIVLDAGDSSGMGKETFERKSTSVAGLPDLLDRFGQRLAAAADVPVERLLGETTKGGLGSGGGSTKIEWWEKHVANMQKRQYLPGLRRLVELLFMAKEGPTNGKVPEQWSIRFRSLSQLSALEEAQRRLAVAQADQIYMGSGGVSPEEIATSRFGGDEYSADTILDDDARGEMQDAIDRMSEAKIGKPDPEELAAQQAALKGAQPVDPTAKDGTPGAKPPPPKAK